MDNKKKGFYLYADNLSLFDSLSYEEKGILWTAIYHYHLGREIPTEDMDRLLTSFFELFRAKLDADSISYNNFIENKSNNGKLGNLKRWNKELYDLVKNKGLSLEDAYDIHYQIQEITWQDFPDKTRNTPEYRLWRKSVLKRDDYTCQKCYKKDVKLHAHHIKPFIQNPDLSHELSNGITLCQECHYKEHRKNAR